MESGGDPVTADPYRILVTGSPDWDDAQELRFALIRASVPHLPDIVVVHEASSAGAAALTAEWAADYGVRTETCQPDEMIAAGAEICLTFIRGASLEAARCADAARQAGIPVQRYLRPGAD
jgi:YspA, cpYpsA-related SLOG family